MNKKIVSVAVFISLFCLATLALADPVSIPDYLGATTFGCLITQIAGAVGNLIAVLGTIMLIVAGILYLTSAGNPGRIETAKKALIYAIVGIFIGLAATAIVNIIKNILGYTGGAAC